MSVSHSSSDFTAADKLNLPIIAVCFMCSMLDGMDVTIISFAAPAIAKAWDIEPSSLGLVFSCGLVGMMLGATLIAPLADRFGRKPIMLAAALIMSSCIYLTSLATNVLQLSVVRFISGLGIATMMAGLASVAAENSPARTRDFWVSLVNSGYPIGAALTGLFSAMIIHEGWQLLFKVAGFITFLSVPVIYFIQKETGEFRNLSKLNSVSVKTLFLENRRQPTMQLWLALFLAFVTMFFLLNWIPKLAEDSGIPMEEAIYAGTIFNFGAIIGIPLQGWLSSRFGLKRTLGLFFALTAFALLIFRFIASSPLAMPDIFVLGFCVQGGFVGLYAMAARMYPTSMRATGLGWAVGIGRLGGMAGLIAGGYLIGYGFDMADSFMAFALPCVIASLVVFNISAKTVS